MNRRRDYSSRRREMVESQIKRRGITDKALLEAMLTVPRERFVPTRYRDFAYEDIPLPIPSGQTISQPFVVARMISLLQLQPDERVLEVGTGSGYVAALLACMAREVYTVERHVKLVQYARRRLEGLAYNNVVVHLGNGTLGWPKHAPYDAIIVSAGGPEAPPSLCRQLAGQGRLVMPVGPRPREQYLTRVTRRGENDYVAETFEPVAFVPLVGEEGWPNDERPGGLRI